jgi:hypothetical protein
MSSETQSIVSLAISCLAFLVSGVALGWTIYRDLLDRGRLKIDLMIGMLVSDHPSHGPVFVAREVS